MNDVGVALLAMVEAIIFLSPRALSHVASLKAYKFHGSPHKAA